VTMCILFLLAISYQQSAISFSLPASASACSNITCEPTQADC